MNDEIQPGEISEDDPADDATDGVRPMCERAHIGVYPGTFDPVTNGHTDIIARAAKMLHKPGHRRRRANPGQDPRCFSLDERMELVRAEADTDRQAHRHRHRGAERSSGLLVAFARSVNAGVIVRGLRAVTDFDYEFQMVGMNHRLDPGGGDRLLHGERTSSVHLVPFRQRDRPPRWRREQLRAEADACSARC